MAGPSSCIRINEIYKDISVLFTFNASAIPKALTFQIMLPKRFSSLRDELTLKASAMEVAPFL